MSNSRLHSILKAATGPWLAGLVLALYAAGCAKGPTEPSPPAQNYPAAELSSESTNGYLGVLAPDAGTRVHLFGAHSQSGQRDTLSSVFIQSQSGDSVALHLDEFERITDLDANDGFSLRIEYLDSGEAQVTAVQGDSLLTFYVDRWGHAGTPSRQAATAAAGRDDVPLQLADSRSLIQLNTTCGGAPYPIRSVRGFFVPRTPDYRRHYPVQVRRTCPGWPCASYDIRVPVIGRLIEANLAQAYCLQTRPAICNLMQQVNGSDLDHRSVAMVALEALCPSNGGSAAACRVAQFLASHLGSVCDIGCDFLYPITHDRSDPGPVTGGTLYLEARLGHRIVEPPSYEVEFSGLLTQPMVITLDVGGGEYNDVGSSASLVIRGHSIYAQVNGYLACAPEGETVQMSASRMGLGEEDQTPIRATASFLPADGSFRGNLGPLLPCERYAIVVRPVLRDGTPNGVFPAGEFDVPAVGVGASAMRLGAIVQDHGADRLRLSPMAFDFTTGMIYLSDRGLWWDVGVSGERVAGIAGLDWHSDETSVITGEEMTCSDGASLSINLSFPGSQRVNYWDEEGVLIARSIPGRVEIHIVDKPHTGSVCEGSFTRDAGHGGIGGDGRIFAVPLDLGKVRVEYNP